MDKCFSTSRNGSTKRVTKLRMTLMERLTSPDVNSVSTDVCSSAILFPLSLEGRNASNEETRSFSSMMTTSFHYPLDCSVPYPCDHQTRESDYHGRRPQPLHDYCIPWDYYVPFHLMRVRFPSLPLLFSLTSSWVGSCIFRSSSSSLPLSLILF